MIVNILRGSPRPVAEQVAWLGETLGGLGLTPTESLGLLAELQKSAQGDVAVCDAAEWATERAKLSVKNVRLSWRTGAKGLAFDLYATNRGVVRRRAAC